MVSIFEALIPKCIVGKSLNNRCRGTKRKRRCKYGEVDGNCVRKGGARKNVDVKALAKILRRGESGEFILENYPITVAEGSIQFKNETGEVCIRVDHADDALTLAEYYSFASKCTCPVISHEWFFNEFLKPLASKLRVPITLSDSSSKKYDHCTVKAFVFAMAVNKTFYSKFGFKNARYMEEAARAGKMKMSEILEEVLADRKASDDFFLKYDEPLTGELLDELGSTVARRIIETCKEGGDVETMNKCSFILELYYHLQNKKGQFGLTWKARTRRKS